VDEDKDATVNELLRALDSSLIHISRERTSVQKRLASRASMLAGIELTYPAILILETLSEKPLRVTEMADLLQMPAPSATRHTQEMERRGLVTRCADQQDRRASVLTLTEEGIKAAEAVGTLRIERLRRAMGDWELNDLRRVKTLFQRLNDSLSNI
jgi:DNA-binding MarR family transcriptional regulator